MKFLRIVVTVLVIIPIISQASAITSENRHNRPDILAIRKLYQQLQNDVDKEIIILQETKEAEFCGSGGDTIRKIYRDEQGIIRVYHVEGGSEHTNLRLRFYYDKDGNLFFAHHNASKYYGRDAGFYAEAKLYIKDNKIIWEKWNNGSNSEYNYSWSDDERDFVKEIINDPQAHFDSEISDCS